MSVNADASKLIWTLKNSTGAATLAPGATLQLTTTAYTYAGDSVTGLPAATFISSDSTKVTVSPTGLMTAVAATTTSNVNVISSLTVAGVTHRDTTIVAVSPVAHTLKTLSVHPGPYQSSTFSLGDYGSVIVTALDSMDDTLQGLAVKLVSSAPLIADFIYGQLYAYAKGQVTVVASTTSFGVTKRDSLTYTITNPMTGSVYCYEHAYVPYEPAFYYNNPLIIGVGGTVTWYNYGNMATTITFADSTNVTGGNIPSIPLYSSATRTFSKTGTYVFTDVLGDSGTVIVIPN